jgi:NADPH:quinone reductase
MFVGKCRYDITPRIMERYPLERGGEAIAQLAGRAAIGKLVVEIAE